MMQTTEGQASHGPVRRVALVDDDHDVRAAAAESLTLAGYRVDAHASA